MALGRGFDAHGSCTPSGSIQGEHFLDKLSVL